MPIVVRNFSIYGANGRKFDYATDGKLAISANGSELKGDGVWLGVSKGIATTSFSTNVIIAVGGNEGTRMVLAAVMDQEYIKMSFGIIDGYILACTMAATEAGYDTSMDQGTLTGAFSFIGGKPEKIG